jgi:hypothetical protein
MRLPDVRSGGKCRLGQKIKKRLFIYWHILQLEQSMMMIMMKVWKGKKEAHSMRKRQGRT